MIAIGASAPDFSLKGGDGGVVSLGDLLDGRSAVVLAFYLLDFSGG